MTTPSFMIGIEEVLDARIASGAATTASSRRNRSTLAASSSTIASTTTSRSASASRSVTTRIRASTSAAESILPFASARCSDFSSRPSAAFAGVLARLDDDHVLPGARADLGDARPHQAATDHSHVLHALLLGVRAGPRRFHQCRRRRLRGGFGPWDGAGPPSTRSRQARDGRVDVARHRDQRRALGRAGSGPGSPAR